MRRLLLCSNGQAAIDLLPGVVGKPANQTTIAWVTTASKAATDKVYIGVHRQAMSQAGFQFEEIDIEDTDSKQLETRLQNKDVLYIEGGNTFYLLQAIKKTGFDRVISQLLDRGLLYVGTSAGASITGPSIALSGHLPANASTDDMAALNLVPFLIKAHYTPDKRLELELLMKKISQPIKILQDGQGLLVEGDNVMFLGSGKEVVL